MSRFSKWSVIWDTIEEAPLHVWRGLPFSKQEASRLVWQIYQRSIGIGYHFRRDPELGFLEVERERLAEHDVIWVRRRG